MKLLYMLDVLFKIKLGLSTNYSSSLVTNCICTEPRYSSQVTAGQVGGSEHVCTVVHQPGTLYRLKSVLIRPQNSLATNAQMKVHIKNGQLRWESINRFIGPASYSLVLFLVDSARCLIEQY